MPLSGASNSARPRASAGVRPGLAGETGVVLAGVGIEASPVLLVDLEGLQDRLEGAVGRREHRRAVDRRESGAVAGAKRVGDHLVGAGVGHLEGGEQRDARLVVAAVGAAVPGQAAGGAVVDALVGLVLQFENAR